MGIPASVSNLKAKVDNLEVIVSWNINDIIFIYVGIIFPKHFDCFFNKVFRNPYTQYRPPSGLQFLQTTQKYKPSTTKYSYGVT